jgi:cell wall-associated NlpC family hydrolase
MTTEYARTYQTADPREWITHVGIYLGGGRMLNAESAGIREVAAFEGYWGDHYAGAGRPAGR